MPSHSKMLEINSVYPHNIAKQYNDITEIVKINCSQLTYDDFFRKYMLANRPLIINGIATNWQCNNWINNKSDVKIDFEYLQGKIATMEVPVADCQKQYQNAHVKLDLDFYKFLDYWKHSMTKTTDQLLYLKDWHLRKIMPEYEFYKTPEYFGSDWLNEHLAEKGNDDYRFVYMGPKGTW